MNQGEGYNFPRVVRGRRDVVIRMNHIREVQRAMSISSLMMGTKGMYCALKVSMHLFLILSWEVDT